MTYLAECNEGKKIEKNIWNMLDLVEFWGDT